MTAGGLENSKDREECFRQTMSSLCELNKVNCCIYRVKQFSTPLLKAYDNWPESKWVFQDEFLILIRNF